jgi:hypothetical protein
MGIQSGIRDGAFGGGPLEWGDGGGSGGDGGDGGGGGGPAVSSLGSPALTDWGGGSMPRRSSVLSNVSNVSDGFSGPPDQHPLADDLRADFSNPLAGGEMDGFSGW